MQGAASVSALIGIALDNKYRILRAIGRGGMGEVFEAEHVTLGKRVAIKLMLEKYTGDAEAVTRFTREALAASRIGNPHIIDVMDIGTAPDGRAFVVMELLTGAPLSRVLEDTGPLPPQRAIAIIRQVLRAVGAAHAKGIVHRDLKPDNIFLVTQGDQPDFVKLLDFGISKMIDPDLQVAATRLTTTGVVMGTPLYMAPEQAMGADVDHRADLYACGVILYELLAGKPPFDGATYAVLVAKLLTTEPVLLNEVRPGISAKLTAAVHRALEKEPAQRFDSAEAFIAALPQHSSASALELAGTLDSGQVRAVPRPSRPAVIPRRWPIIAAAVTLLLGIGTATFVFMGRPAPPAPAPLAAPSPSTSTTPGAASPAAPTPSGLLRVTSSPTGASVFIDDRPSGPTPLEVTLAEGTHVVRLELAGHETVRKEYAVPAHVLTAANFDLVVTPAASSYGVPAPSPAAAPKGTKKAPPKVVEKATPKAPAKAPAKAPTPAPPAPTKSATSPPPPVPAPGPAPVPAPAVIPAPVHAPTRPAPPPGLGTKTKNPYDTSAN